MNELKEIISNYKNNINKLNSDFKTAMDTMDAINAFFEEFSGHLANSIYYADINNELANASSLQNDYYTTQIDILKNNFFHNINAAISSAENFDMEYLSNNKDELKEFFEMGSSFYKSYFDNASIVGSCMNVIAKQLYKNPNFDKENLTVQSNCTLSELAKFIEEIYPAKLKEHSSNPSQEIENSINYFVPKRHTAGYGEKVNSASNNELVNDSVELGAEIDQGDDIA